MCYNCIGIQCNRKNEKKENSLVCAFKYFKEIDSITLKISFYVFTHCLRPKIVRLFSIHSCSYHTRSSLTHTVCVAHTFCCCFFVIYTFSLSTHCSSPVWRMYFVVAVQHHRLINGSVAHIFCCYFCVSMQLLKRMQIMYISYTPHLEQFARQISVDFSSVNAYNSLSQRMSKSDKRESSAMKRPLQPVQLFHIYCSWHF